MEMRLGKKWEGWVCAQATGKGLIKVGGPRADMHSICGQGFDKIEVPGCGFGSGPLLAGDG
jgi:hypothetical protein